MDPNNMDNAIVAPAGAGGQNGVGVNAGAMSTTVLCQWIGFVSAVVFYFGFVLSCHFSSDDVAFGVLLGLAFFAASAAVVLAHFLNLTERLYAVNVATVVAAGLISLLANKTWAFKTHSYSYHAEIQSGNSVLKVNMLVEAGQNRTLILPDTITAKSTSPVGEFPLSTSSPDSHDSLSLWQSTIGTSNTEPSSKSTPPGLVIQPTRRSKSPSRKVVKSRLVNIFQRLRVEDEHRLADIMSQLVTQHSLMDLVRRL
jgi:hypothetical protein